MTQTKDTATYLLKELFKRFIVQEKNNELWIKDKTLYKELEDYVIYIMELWLLEHTKAQLTYPHKERMRVLEWMLTNCMISNADYYKTIKDLYAKNTDDTTN